MAIRPRGMGEILDGAFRLYAQDVGLYLSTAIVASVPFGLMMVIALVSGGSPAAAIGVVLLAPIAIATMTAMWIALAIQMHERLEGREPSLPPAARRSFALILRVIWAGIIVYFVMLATFGLGIVVIAFASGLVATLGSPIAAVILMIVGAIALCVWLGVKILAGLVLFLPAITVEGLAAYESVKRGLALAKGGQGRILGVMFVASLLVAVPLMAIYFVTGTTSMLMNPEALTSGTISTGQLVAQQFLTIVASGFTTPYIVACILLLYFDQRIRREAYDLQSEAEALAG